MKHNLIVEGLGYRLRPVKLSDAQFIVDIRISNSKRNQFIHTTSNDVELQKSWIEKYFDIQGDYYFIVENSLSSEPEGTIGIYNIENNRAEWGRWVLKEDSLASIESIELIFKAAFTRLCLDELFCRTIIENKNVVEFHNNTQQLQRGIIKNYVHLNDTYYDVMEHYVPHQYYVDTLQVFLESKAYMVYKRNIKILYGGLEFHHIGIATNNIEKEFSVFRMLGYQREGKVFEDYTQGIRGLFITSENQPRLELLENLTDSITLNKWIDANIKIYHFAYKVKKIEKAVEVLGNKRVRLISPLKFSTYFQSRICFLVLPNSFIIELIEDI